MTELEIAKKALNAISVCENNPDTDRRACNFAVENMFKVQEKNHITLDFPIQILWKITGKCNSNCVHCWASLGCSHERKELLKVAEEIAQLNAMMVSISGGDPFLCKDIFDILSVLKSKNIIVEIMSNGSLITENIACKLSKILNLDTDAVQISLDGSTAEIHNKQRNSKIFYLAIEGIKNLRKYGIKVRIAFCTTYINQEDIVNTYKLANQLDAQTFSAVPVFKFRRAESFTEDVNDLVYLEQIVKCKDMEGQCSTKLRLHANQFYPYLIDKYYNELDFDSYKTTNSYIFFPNETNASIQIDSHGEMVPGPEWDVDFSGGNVYQQSIKEIWDRGKNWGEFRKGRNLENTKCEKCRVYSICQGGSMKYAYEKYGTINMPDGTCMLGE